MALPGATSRIINDLISGTTHALQDRTDIASIAPFYIKRALQEITTNWPFEELRVVGPNVSTIVAQYNYPVAAFLNSGDDLSFVESIVVFVDPPGNTVDYSLNYKTPKGIEMMLSPTTLGVPAWWSRFGTQIYIGPNPSQVYTLFMRYQRRHPFPSDDQLQSAPIYVPEDWEEIVEYAAAERIAIVKRWNDQVNTIHTILYGDPAAGTNVDGTLARPGLIKARLMQTERDAPFNTRNLGIVVPRYSSR